jgi:hypothetical protein
MAFLGLIVAVFLVLHLPPLARVLHLTDRRDRARLAIGLARAPSPAFPISSRPSATWR